MAVSNVPPFSLYSGDGVILSFSITFPFLINTDIRVYLVEAGLPTLQVEGVDYTVTGGDPGDHILFTVEPSLTQEVYVYRSTPRTQADSLAVRQTYVTAVLEKNLDKITWELQELQYGLDHATGFRNYVNLTTFDNKFPDALLTNPGTMPIINAAGTGWDVGPTAADITEAISAVDDAIAAAAAASSAAAAAAASASGAATSASSASSSASAAAASESAAATSETNAANSADDADQSDQNAEAAASAASASETNALNSANAAAASASTATTQASAASASATAASGSATTASTQATNAAASAVAAAASAVAAAASAASASTTIVGTRAAPTNVVAANGILFTSTTYRTVNFVQGNGGSVFITAAARIQAGTIVGQILELIGRSDANFIQIPDGNGVITGGITIQLLANSIVEFFWDGTNWVLKSTNGLM